MCAVMTNHDLNLSLRYCNRFIMMKGGRIHAAGGREIINPGNIREVYGLEVYVGEMNGIPLIIPK
jgi:iron complex transport system ATP-binding protein